ncbi:MAG: hypothetical protein BBJ57_02320 [Desulfobacterales bacterium PC51MH44]|nr:MAG: hypothetical protein BBJ57_02320 [Desulfobacterales bacterium PC51MH44]
MLYDDYNEIEWTDNEVVILFDKYLKWCEKNNEKPEVTNIYFVNKLNIGHIAYHARLWFQNKN